MTEITLVSGVGPALMAELAKAGIDSAEKLAATTPETLTGIHGVGARTAPRLIAAARLASTAPKTAAGDDPLAPPPRPNAEKPGKKKAKGDGKKDGKKKDKRKKEGRKDAAGKEKKKKKKSGKKR